MSKLSHFELKRVRLGKSKRDKSNNLRAKREQNNALRAAWNSDNKSKAGDFPLFTCGGKGNSSKPFKIVKGVRTQQYRLEARK